MNFNVADLPAVRAQLERDAAALKERHVERAQALAKGSAPQYARAPEATGALPAGARPAAGQRSSR